MISELDDVVPRPVLVMTRVTCAPDDMPELLELAEASAPIFARQPGFVGSEIFKSTDDTRLVSLLRWRREADHVACMASPHFAELNERFQRLLRAGRISFEDRVLVRVATVEP